MKSSKLATLALTSLFIAGCGANLQSTNNSDNVKSLNQDSNSVDKSKNNLSEIKQTKNISTFSSIKLSKDDIANLDKEYLSFSTKALTKEYFKKKLESLIGNDNGVASGSKIVKELKYAQYKSESVIPFKSMSNDNPIFYTTLVSVAAVMQQRSGDTPFNVFLGGVNPYPVSPSGLTSTTITTTSFNANWSNVTDATAYEISIDNGVTINVGNVLTYTVTGLVVGSNHTFKVRALKGSLTGPYSSDSNLILAPDTPSGLNVSTITSTGFSANWSAVANATGYHIVVDNNSPITLGNVTTYSVSGLTPSTNHTFKVRAINGSLIGNYSADSSTITLLPATPTASSATDGNVTGFTANWTAVASATSGYVLTLKQGSTTISTIPIGSQATNNYIFTGLTTGATYTYTVQSKNGSLLSAESNSISVTADYTTTTFAGSSYGYADGTGTAAKFRNPIGGGVDSNGNVYIADLYNNSIRKITPTGVVTTFAGIGSAASGDATNGTANGTGTDARFSRPTGISFDASGNMYVADQTNQRIRMITPGGVVSNIAISGFVDPTSTAVAPDGTIYVADQNSATIKKIANDANRTVTVFAGSGLIGSTDGAANVAKFQNPTGIVRDSLGNLYVSEQFTYKIRKIDSNGNVSTLAGSGVSGFADGTGTNAKFAGCYGLAIDSNNNLYVGDYGNHRIRKVTPAGVVTTLAGNGTAGSVDGTRTNSQLNQPHGVAVNSSGTIIYVIEYGGNKIRKIQ